LCNEKTSGQATLVYIHYPRNRLETEVQFNRKVTHSEVSQSVNSFSGISPILPFDLQEKDRMTRITRRHIVLGICTISCTVLTRKSSAKALDLHCTPAPAFPVPLDIGTWRSAEFPVGKHAYNVSFIVDRRPPLEQLDCDLGPAPAGHRCETPPLLDIDWKVWDGKTLVKSWHADPVKADAWAAKTTSCILGGFEGGRNGMFTLEWTVKKDAGRLRELHPRIEIVKNPGYWCWL
jgi:hypothetical protein